MGGPGRDGEWARLVAAVTPEFTDPATGGPVPGRAEYWSIITGYRVRLARQARDWPTATTLLTTMIAWDRDRAAAALAAPSTHLTERQRRLIGSLCVSLGDLGNILLVQEDPACLPHFQEALTLDQQIGDRQGEAEGAGSLGNAYLRVPGLRDLDQAEHWFQRSLSLRLDSDRLGRAQCLSSLGGVAIRRFDDGLVAGDAEPILLQYLNAARRHYLQSLDLTPAGDHEARANREHQLGVIYDRAGDTRQALLHYQQSIQHEEERGNIFGAGQTRFNIAHAVADDGRVSDALHYARAALDNYQQAGPGAASDAEQARQFIADLEQRDR